MNDQTKFYTNKLKKLVGSKIESVTYAEEDNYGNEFFGLVIKLKNGKEKILWLLSDDEGNAPGSFDIQNKGE